MKQKNKHRLIEWGKDILILLLTCSACWMVASSGLLSVPLGNLLRQERPAETTKETESVGWMEAVRPTRMIATLIDGEHLLRCGIQYDQAAVDTLYQQTASLLVEALFNVEKPKVIARAQWERALQTAPGLCFDFQGNLPISVLLGWLSGDTTDLNATVRRLLLTAENGSVALYYYDTQTRSYYRGKCTVTTPAQLEAAISGLSDNGAIYAFEMEAYHDLGPDTLLTPSTQGQLVYQTSNPVNAGRSSLERLMEDFGFTLTDCNFYSAEDEVARFESGTMRLSGLGVVEYHAGEKTGESFSIPSSDSDQEKMYTVVERCRQITYNAMNSRCGEAQFYLSEVQELEGGWEISFDYCLNGSPVWLEKDHAARFQIRNGQVIFFSIQLRNYISTGEIENVMPPLQANAALQAMGLRGHELGLVYRDHGGERMSASWMAIQTEGI